jgi:hypothetical protein
MIEVEINSSQIQLEWRQILQSKEKWIEKGRAQVSLFSVKREMCILGNMR